MKAATDNKYGQCCIWAIHNLVVVEGKTFHFLNNIDIGVGRRKGGQSNVCFYLKSDKDPLPSITTYYAVLLGYYMPRKNIM